MVLHVMMLHEQKCDIDETYTGSGEGYRASTVTVLGAQKAPGGILSTCDVVEVGE